VEVTAPGEHPKFSIIVPIFNEEAVIAELCSRLKDTMAKLPGASEVVLVDDGSRDRSRDLIREVCASDPRFKLVGLSRNFGHQMAVTAGLEHASGDAVITMDADLQDPPELLPDMIAKWQEGFDVVYGVREDRSSDTRFKRGTARLFYRILGRLTEFDIPADVGDFRLVDRRVIDAVGRMPERSRFLRGMFTWVGFKQTGVPYTRPERFAGETKYTVRKMVNFAADGVINFSIVPLRLALNVGFVFVALSILGAMVAVGAKLVGAFTIPGWASITVAVLLLGGIQLFMLGVVGEYVGRIYEEVKARPLYLVSETAGFRPPAVNDRVDTRSDVDVTTV